MRILPRKETICFVYPLVVGRSITSAGQTIPTILLLILATSVIICLIFDIRFLVEQIKKLRGGG